MITLFKRMDTLDVEQSRQSRRIGSVEGKVGNNGQALRFAERIFWIAVTGAVAAAFSYLKG